jgi:hypothetical protein
MLVEPMFNLKLQANQPSRVYCGYQVHLLAKRLDPETKALLAVELGAAQIHGLTDKQARQLVGVSAGYFRTAKALTPAQRAAIHAGAARLSSFHNSWRVDSRLDRIMQRYGPDAVMRALDRATTPAVAAE